MKHKLIQAAEEEIEELYEVDKGSTDLLHLVNSFPNPQ